MRSARLRLLVLGAAVALIAVACGGGDDDEATETTAGAAAATTAAPAATTTAAPITTTAAPETTTAAPATTVASGGDTVELTIEAEDSEGFSVSKLEAPAGAEITVTFQNKDVSSGEPHNWHLLTGTDMDDYFTPVTPGPDTNSVTFTISTPGEYEFQCDTHLTAMQGVLVITP